MRKNFLIFADHKSLRHLSKINQIKPVLPDPNVNRIVQNRLYEKDFLVICDVGAYGTSLASNYNLRPKPIEILIKGSKIQIISKRQKISELM